MKKYFNFSWGWGRKKDPPKNGTSSNKEEKPATSISPGRVSVDDDSDNLITSLQGLTKLVEPSFRVDVIPLIRDLYKVNPDMGIALQDMFKLANTSHTVTFPNNTDAEASKMREHLKEATKGWTRYTAGIDGLVNKMIVQLLVSGAISVEGVPNDELDGLATVFFLIPVHIKFKRELNGV